MEIHVVVTMRVQESVYYLLSPLELSRKQLIILITSIHYVALQIHTRYIHTCMHTIVLLDECMHCWLAIRSGIP